MPLTIPDWEPPLDNGIPSAVDLNDLSDATQTTVAAANSILPVTYGRDRVLGKIIALHIDETTGFMYVGFSFGEGEIEEFETVFLDGIDIDDATAGLLSFAGAAVEYYKGTASQTASPLLSGVISGYTDALPNVVYTVFKIPTQASQGFPRVDAIIKGQKVYDPRKFAVTDDPQFDNLDDTDLATATWFGYHTGAFTAESVGFAKATVNSPVSVTGLEITDNDSDSELIFGKLKKIKAGQKYTAHGYGKQTAGDRINYLAVAFFDKNGDHIQGNTDSDATGWPSKGIYHYWEVVASTFPGTWTEYNFEFGPGATPTIPTGAVYMRVGAWCTYTGTTSSTVQLSDLRIYEGGIADEQLADDSTTWLYSVNPSLCFLHLIMTHTDWGYHPLSIGECADHNDTVIGSGGDAQALREVGVTLLRPQSIGAWVKGFRAYMGAMLVWDKGKVRAVPLTGDTDTQGALSLDGSASTYASVGDIAELDFDAATDFTIEAWFNTATTATDKILVSKKATAAGVALGYILYIDASEDIAFRMSDGVNTVLATFAGTYTDGEWHHVAVSVDRVADTITLIVDYVEGTPVSSTTVGTLVNSEVFRVGANGSGTERFTGEIDEVRVWNTTKTAAQLQAYSTRELDISSEGTNVIGYWRFNDRSGLTAVDSSINENDATLTGNATFIYGNPDLVPVGVVKHFTIDDVVDNSIGLTKKSARGTPSVVQVEYIDHTNEVWRADRQETRNPKVDTGEVAKRYSTVSLPGIHRPAQAKRESIERLNWLGVDLDCRLIVFDEGLSVLVGSIIAITHPLGIDTKLFRVIRATDKSGRWLFFVREYDPAVYSQEIIADPSTPDTILGNPLSPPLVGSLTVIEELFNYKSGLTGSRVRASWSTNYPFASQYLVEGYVDGALVFSLYTALNTAVTPPVEELVSSVSVEYEIRVSIVTPYTVGAAATSTVDILGKLAAPSDVPQINATLISADTAEVTWEAATDIDIWRYDLRIGTTADTFATATQIDLIDGLQHTVSGLALGTNRLFIKAVDTVGNVSATATHVDVVTSLPSAVGELRGIEVASEVRLSWDQVTTEFVDRYRVAYSDIPQTFETDIDIVDGLRLITKDIPEGTFRFKVYAVNALGEALTAATKDIEVTSDADAFLADDVELLVSSTTNMHEYQFKDYPTTNKKFYITHVTGDTFNGAGPPHDFDSEAVTLAGYHPSASGEWLSETKDFGTQLAGNFTLTTDAIAVEGTITIELELSTDNIIWDAYTTLSVRDTYRYARVRITSTTTNTAFVMTPTMNLKVSVVPIEENGQSISNSGSAKTITLGRAYTNVKEIVVTPLNVTEPRTAVVDNIVVGATTSFDVYIFDLFGQQLATDFRWQWKGV